jgi:hypothetical protein
MKKLLICLAFVILCFSAAYGQPRLVTKPETKPEVLAPVSFDAKYEGGMFGFNKKEEGTLKFDDNNLRLVFFSKENKELFAIPYKTMIVIYPQTTSTQSTTGKVVGAAPLPGAGIAGAFIKEKKRYLIINFDDPDMNAKGIANFKLENRELLEKVITTLGDKAELQQRGDSYFRPTRAQYPGN